MAPVTRTASLSLLLIGLLIAAPPASASDEGQVAVQQVSQLSYIDFMDNWLYTHTGDSRGPSGAEHDPARDNILAFFLSYGLDAELEPFTYWGGSGENVVAVKLGTVHPEQEFIVGAHYDSVSNPGADDNASGVALVLEAARILSQYPSEYTIRFIAFDQEETGLNGSSAYVDAHINDDILGMISCDMVAYDPDTDHALVYTHTASHALRDALGAAVNEYGDGLTWEDAGWISASNHAPFDEAGFQAGLLIEGSVWDNPYYHTQSDAFETPDNLNFPYAVKMTRSVVGWLVDSALVHVAPLIVTLPDGTPWRIDPGVPTPIVVEIKNGGETYVPGSGLLHYRFDGGEYLTVPVTPLGDNRYDAVLPAAACDATPEFYFSALGDEGSTMYSPEDAPAGTYTALVATLTTHFFDNFETDLGWTVESFDLTTGAWERGVPAGDGTRGDPTSDFDGSGHCYVTDNRAGNYDIDGGPTRLTSPAIDLAVTLDPVLKYARWFYNDDEDVDRLNVEVSNDDGATWTLIESVPHTVGWVHRTVHLAECVTPTAQMRLRFTASDNPNNSMTEAAVDALEIYELTCFLPTGDYDADGDVDLHDSAAFQACYSADGGPFGSATGCEIFDFDGDADTDWADWLTFSNRLGQP